MPVEDHAINTDFAEILTLQKDFRENFPENCDIDLCASRHEIIYPSSA